MLVDGKQYQSIWIENEAIFIINQNKLPWEFEIKELKNTNDIINAINTMEVRGAPLIGVSAALGVYLAINESTDQKELEQKVLRIKETRPTAVNLIRGLEFVLDSTKGIKVFVHKSQTALGAAIEFMENEVEACRKIGENGVSIIEEISKKKKYEVVNILTHCNAGWLACVDYGTASAPIYSAHNKGINVHVWVDETRPRNQGARLTAWEMEKQGIPYTIISDNTGGHLMQNGMVDICLVGSDRTTRNGDTANKIGTYQKALSAKDNNVPFYVALPYSSIDFDLEDGSEIQIEQRPGDEIKYIEGYSNNQIQEILLTPLKSPSVNFAFDITPNRLISEFITEKGIFTTGDSFK